MKQKQMPCLFNPNSQIHTELANIENGSNLNFLERSGFQPRIFIYEEIFSEIQEISLKYLQFDFQNEHENQSSLMKQQQNCQQTTQDPIFSVLQFKRGFSQFIDLRKEKSEEQCLNYVNQQCRLKSLHQCCDKQKQIQSYNSSDSIPFQFSLQFQQQVYIPKKIKKNSAQSESKKESTKNVTKNMGKLLLKWIWENKQSLQTKFKDYDAIWHQFIGKIKTWKKQNNITRKFLNQRWHGHSDDCKLFRIISAYFFRKIGYSAISESNIENKMMHVSRLKKFLEGVGDPSALDSLN